MFKKPFELSESLEFLIGAGPEWVHKASGDNPGDSVSAEAIVQLVYFPWEQHRVGFFVEPVYEYNFGKDHTTSRSASPAGCTSWFHDGERERLAAFHRYQCSPAMSRVVNQLLIHVDELIEPGPQQVPLPVSRRFLGFIPASADSLLSRDNLDEKSGNQAAPVHRTSVSWASLVLENKR